jgi:hypothetical protein
MKWFFIWLDDKVRVRTIAPNPNIKVLITHYPGKYAIEAAG